MSSTNNAKQTELVVSDSPVGNHLSKVASLSNQVIPGLCENGFIEYLKSIHLANAGDTIKLNMCFRTLGDAKHHWITETYTDLVELKAVLQTAIDLHKCNSGDDELMEEWSNELNDWKAGSNAPLSLYRAD